MRWNRFDGNRASSLHNYIYVYVCNVQSVLSGSLIKRMRVLLRHVPYWFRSDRAICEILYNVIKFTFTMFPDRKRFINILFGVVDKTLSCCFDFYKAEQEKNTVSSTDSAIFSADGQKYKARLKCWRTRIQKPLYILHYTRSASINVLNNFFDNCFLLGPRLEPNSNRADGNVLITYHIKEALGREKSRSWFLDSAPDHSRRRTVPRLPLVV